MGFIDRLIGALQGLGTPGLFALALVDSGGIPTGGGPDVLLMVLAGDGQLPVTLLVLVPAAVLGSALGCLVPYCIGRAGGEPALARIEPERRERIRRRIDRYGLWAIALSVVAPPPYPMKLFVLSAGVFRMPLRIFLLAVLLGRTARYLLVGLLALRYGEAATDMLGDHYLSAAALVAVLASLFLLWRWQGRKQRGG